MTNRRSPNQTLIAFALTRDLLRAMDDRCAKTGECRSAFIRQAVAAKIRDCQQPFQERWIEAKVGAPSGHRRGLPKAAAKAPRKRPGAAPRRKYATRPPGKKGRR